MYFTCKNPNNPKRFDPKGALTSDQIEMIKKDIHWVIDQYQDGMRSSWTDPSPISNSYDRTKRNFVNLDIFYRAFASPHVDRTHVKRVIAMNLAALAQNRYMDRSINRLLRHKNFDTETLDEILEAEVKLRSKTYGFGVYSIEWEESHLLKILNSDIFYDYEKYKIVRLKKSSLAVLEWAIKYDNHSIRRSAAIHRNAPWDLTLKGLADRRASVRLAVANKYWEKLDLIQRKTLAEDRSSRVRLKIAEKNLKDFIGGE